MSLLSITYVLSALNYPVVEAIQYWRVEAMSVLRSNQFLKWTIVTILAWTIAALINPLTDSPIVWLAQWLTSPISITIVALTQTLLLWNRPHDRNHYLKIIAIQILINLGLQLLFLCVSLLYALAAIAHLGKGGIWSSFVDSNAIVFLAIGIVSNVWVQSWGFRNGWHDRSFIGDRISYGGQSIGFSDVIK